MPETIELETLLVAVLVVQGVLLCLTIGVAGRTYRMYRLTRAEVRRILKSHQAVFTGGQQAIAPLPTTRRRRRR